MATAKVVSHERDRQPVQVILKLLGEAIREPRKSAVRHTYAEIRTLHIAGADFGHVRHSEYGLLASAYTDFLTFVVLAINLHQLREVRILETKTNGKPINGKAIRGHLHMTREA